MAKRSGCSVGKVQIKGKCVKPWKKTRDNGVNITYQHIITKRKIAGAKDKGYISGTWWLPIHMSSPNAGHFIAGVDRSRTKEGIKSNLNKYMKKHPSGTIRVG